MRVRRLHSSRYATGAYAVAVALLMASVQGLRPAAALAQGQSTYEPEPRAEHLRLFRDSRAQLAWDLARGHTDSRLIVAARAGRSRALAERVEALGGSVQRISEAVGYLRLIVPISQVSHVAALPEVAAVALSPHGSDERVMLRDVASSPVPGHISPASGDTSRGEWPPRLSDRPLTRPYSPAADMVSDVFRARDHRFDGRGVTVAIVDGHPDFLLPELRCATDAAGNPTPKFVDVLNASDPLDELSDRETPQWVRMSSEIATDGGRFTHGEESFLAPRAGVFRIGYLNERLFAPPLLLPGHLRGDLNRDGNPVGSDSLFAVLWDRISGEVWVDAEQTRDFSSVRPMLDYRFGNEIGTIGTDNPATEVRESIGFTVQTDSTRGYVSINLGISSHSSMAAGALAGNASCGGRYEGVAPGVRLVAIDQGRTAHGEIEAVITAFEHPDVNVIVLEQNHHPSYVLRDGSSVASIVYDRLVDLYEKPLLVPAGNQPGLGVLEQQSTGRNVLAVNAYQSAESFLVNNGVTADRLELLHWAHAYGPGGDGGLKPDILAPSNVISSSVGFRPGEMRAGLYQLPPGYRVGAGTSTAAPVAGGAVALLVGAARQTGISFDAQSIYRSVRYSARQVPGVPSHHQGNGLVQVDSAWRFLLEMNATAHELPIILSQGPIRSALGPWMAVAGSGSGLFEREGWTAGQVDTRSVRITRVTGQSGAAEYRVRWLGNEQNTFQSAKQVILPKGVPVDLPLLIAPTSYGVHSAVLSIEDESGRSVHRIMTAVVAAHSFRPEDGYSLRQTIVVPRPGAASRFVLVQPDAAALSIRLSAGRGGWTIWLYPPDARENTLFFPLDQLTKERHIGRPVPGVWEITVHDAGDMWSFDESRPDTLRPTGMDLDVRLVGVSVGDSSTAMPEYGECPNSSECLVVRNHFAEFAGAVVSSPLAGAREVSGTIHPGEMQVIDIEVPPGSTSVRAELLEAATLGADLDLYLFDCTGKRCEPRRSSNHAGVSGPVSFSDPPAGRWKVVVDAIAASSDAIAFRYRDLITNPMFGAVATSDFRAVRDVASEWRTAVSAWLPCGRWAERLPLARFVVEGGLVALSRAEPYNSFRHFSEPIELGAAETQLAAPSQTGRPCGAVRSDRGVLP